MDVICPKCYHKNTLSTPLQDGEERTLICSKCGNSSAFSNILSIQADECQFVTDYIITPLSTIIANIVTLQDSIKSRNMPPIKLPKTPTKKLEISTLRQIAVEDAETLIFLNVINAFLGQTQSLLFSHIIPQCTTEQVSKIQVLLNKLKR
jgi:hypothetical protein